MKSDIFFFITSVCVILFSAGLLIAVFYLIRILRDIKHITKILRTQGEHLSNDLSDLRENIRIQGFKYFFPFLFRRMTARRRAKGRSKLADD